MLVDNLEVLFPILVMDATNRPTRILRREPIILEKHDSTLELFDHLLTLDQWAGVLADWLPTEYAERPLPTRATSALPGSPEKVAVLIERQECGEQLFHPDDEIRRDYRRRPRRARPREESVVYLGPSRRKDGTLRGIRYCGYWRAFAVLDRHAFYLGSYDTYAEAEAAVLLFWNDCGFREAGKENEPLPAAPRRRVAQPQKLFNPFVPVWIKDGADENESISDPQLEGVLA